MFLFVAAANSCAGSPAPSPDYLEGSVSQGHPMAAEKDFLEDSPGASSSSFPNPCGDFSAGAAFPRAVTTKDGDVRNSFAPLGVN